MHRKKLKDTHQIWFWFHFLHVWSSYSIFFHLWRAAASPRMLWTQDLTPSPPWVNKLNQPLRSDAFSQVGGQGGQDLGMEWNTETCTVESKAGIKAASWVHERYRLPATWMAGWLTCFGRSGPGRWMHSRQGPLSWLAKPCWDHLRCPIHQDGFTYLFHFSSLSWKQPSFLWLEPGSNALLSRSVPLWPWGLI